MIHSPVSLAEIQVPVLAYSVGAVLTLTVQECGFHFRLCRGPLAHHTHKSPVPRLGGVAVFIAIAFAALLANFVFGFHWIAPALPLLVAALPVLWVGAYDDLRHANPKSKIVAQLLGTAILLAEHWKMRGSLDLRELFFLPLWMVVTTNAFNLIDGLDGLAVGTAVILSLGLAFVQFVSGNDAMGALCVIIAAASLGFLPFNFIRAKIFLGDSGSLTLGFLLAAIAYQAPHRAHVPWIALLIFGYPLTETGLTILRRVLKGRSVLRPDREHLHHKLKHAGFSATRATTLLCLLAAGYASLAVVTVLGATFKLTLACAVALFLAVAKSFGYLRRRSVVLLSRRMAHAREARKHDLPEISGYLPFK